LLVDGQSIIINGETFTEGGTYVQQLETSEGCDSLLTINIVLLSTVIHYDMEDCASNMDFNTHMDYSEFIPIYPQPLECATIVADTLHRENPAMNKHSCTPGVNGSLGMCVGALPGCQYQAGDQASVIVEVNIVPDPDTAVHLTSFSFYEKAPATFTWINGPSGPNNYPTLFGFRVLKNGTEIFVAPVNATQQDWNQRVFDFFENDDFLVTTPTTFRFELLGYCPVGNGAVESVWDLDQVDIVASCAPVNGFNKTIAGIVRTVDGLLMRNVEIQLFDDATFTHKVSKKTALNGKYLYQGVAPKSDYYITAYNNDNPTNGVNTLDLIYIQKHILGITPFQSPYQYIAADANRNNRISVIDLIELKKLLLGKYEHLPLNTSWRFGVASQDLQLSDPWAFSETIAIEYFTCHVTDADFKGVKIGDVNNDAIVDLTSNSWLPRTDARLVFKLENKELTPGVPVTIDVTSDNFKDVAGFQLHLGLERGQILEVISGELVIHEDQFYITPEGQVKMSWFDHAQVDLPSGAVLFSLVVMADVKTMSGEQFELRHHTLRNEAYIGTDYQHYGIALEAIEKQQAEFTNALLGSVPNPFGESTNIRFSLSKPAMVTFNFYNLSGQLVLSREGEFAAGNQSFALDAKELNGSTGIILCRMQTQGFVATEKLVLLRDK
jgi:hypothetical protein